MTDKKTDSSTAPLSDDPVNPNKGGLSAKPISALHPAGAEPRLDTRFHRTSRDSTARPARATLRPDVQEGTDQQGLNPTP